MFFTALFAVILFMGDKRTVIIKPAFENNSLTAQWKEALVTRMPKSRIDSFATIQRPLTVDELDWKKLFESKALRWNAFRDSLADPFPGIKLTDTIYILTGFAGVDDGFTFEHNNVCLDLTAFVNNYGKASLPENDNRADRIFSHEYTHLLHKAWAKKTKLEVKTFRDSVLWECLYEGIGMYRSLSEKWKPVNGVLPQATQDVLKELIPQFVKNIAMVESNRSLTETEKEAIVRNLSRGPVNKKWGAFAVGIWLMLEANGNDKNLAQWINRGPEGIPALAKKRLVQ